MSRGNQGRLDAQILGRLQFTTQLVEHLPSKQRPPGVYPLIPGVREDAFSVVKCLAVNI